MGTTASQISIYPGMLCIKNTIRQATLQGHPGIDKTRHLFFLFQLKHEGYRSSELNKKAPKPTNANTTINAKSPDVQHKLHVYSIAHVMEGYQGMI